MHKEILIIDDQPGIRMLLTDVFENEGYKVTTAADGEEAIKKLYENRYDAVLVDYKLPIISGVEILRKLEQDNINVPIIVMSGLADEIEKELSEFQLVKEVLGKPFDIQQLVGNVKKIIG
ncbi:response regulator [Virgibacillus sp. YIM 98842]|jgi:DNA-binding response OmpR family regulator|uniref:response regulator n=1 Tax=Virgibacillus sp. YIM 98842 TaxID=2663533 RepID=UPI0013DA6872|nr:response regulator [Virgibacillus sp. YIM 98842]